MMRFWRFALLTLLIALLPLRGWAWAVMPVAVPGHAASNAAALVVPHGAHAVADSPADAPHQRFAKGASPCHGHGAMAMHHLVADASESKVLDASSDTADHPADTGHTHTCSLCDLCHAGVSVPPSWAWFHDAPPVSPPSWAVSTTPGRDGTDGLFRPPRA
jgi:hypothetical protein